MDITNKKPNEDLLEIYCNGMLYMPVTLIDDYKKKERKKILAEVQRKMTWLKPDEAAKYLNISKSTLYKYTCGRKIPFYKPSEKKMLFLQSELDEFLKSKRAKTIDEIDEDAANYEMGVRR